MNPVMSETGIILKLTLNKGEFGVLARPHFLLLKFQKKFLDHQGTPRCPKLSRIEESQNKIIQKFFLTLHKIFQLLRKL